MSPSAAATRAAGAPRLLVTTNVPSTLTAFLLPYAEHFRARGWRVDAACNGGPACEACAEAFDHVYHVPWTRRPADRVNFWGAPRALRRLVAEQGYDIVHTHDPVAAFVTRLALRGVRRRRGVTVVYTAHGFHFYRGAPPIDNLLYGTVETIASRWTDELVVMNREDLEAARRFPMPEDRITYMPGIGVDMSRYDPGRVTADAVAAVRRELGLADDRRLLLMVAEFLPRKGHLDAVAALARAGDERVVLACAGDGPTMDAARAEAERLGVGGRVRFLGFRNDIGTLLQASFALILPSRLEGLPRCIMEASCLERPTVAYRIRGVSELIDDTTGVLCEPGDVEALASAVRRLAGDPETVRAMGVRARQKMDAFELGHLLELHERLYARALARRGGAAARAPAGG